MSITKDEYYLGVDIRSDSVGWAVTDENYNIMSSKGKMLWGVRLFEEGENASKRKSVRSDRKRTQRRRGRIALLQQLFEKEINKVDKEFFTRLRESRLIGKDKSTDSGYTLFNDKEYTDIDYYKDYPTIYHLRKDLIHSEEKKDIRLIYLAIHHIIRRRGHFYFDGDVSSVTSFDNIYNKFVSEMKSQLGVDYICENIDEVARIFKSRTIGITQKKSKLMKIFDLTREDKQAMSILGIIIGGSAKLVDIFDDAELGKFSSTKIELTENLYQETYNKIEANCNNRCDALKAIKDMYDWIMLSNILQDEECSSGSNKYLSSAKVSRYNKHHEDLRILKFVLKQIGQEEYNNMFNSMTTKYNYCAYIGSARQNGKKKSVNRCETEEFYGYTKNIIKNNYDKLSEVGREKAEYILETIRQETFLDLQMHKNNRVIPSQLHRIELVKILDNAEKHYHFLSQKDENGISNADKIKRIYDFRIPYYVGPLNDYHNDKGGNAWVAKRSVEKVTPWNFNKVVDIDESAKRYIHKTSMKCECFIREEALPENSLVYSEFRLINSLNGIIINGKRITSSIKTDLIENLYKKRKRVDKKAIYKYLKENYNISEDSILGISTRSIKPLISYNDFKKKVFGKKIDESKYQILTEKIIRYITIYGMDKKMLLSVLEREFGEILSPNELKQIGKLNYIGWGKYSDKLLTHTQGTCYETGERSSLIYALRHSENNLEEILGSKYSFKEIIEEYQSKIIVNKDEISYNNLVKNLVLPASIKRPIWQMIKIVEEIKKVKGKEPTKIFVNVSKGAQENLATESIKLKLLAAYNKISGGEELRKGIEPIRTFDLRNTKLYLYYTQKGKCMYTGEDIDINDVYNTELYDKDHIYPASKTKDDSSDNLVLVKKSANNSKGNNLVPMSVQLRMNTYWATLLKQGFISQEKYNRLTRVEPLTAEELASFIDTQFRDNAYSTKVVSRLLKKTNINSEVVYVRTGLVSEFRQKVIKKPRITTTSDLYHAKDAYLDIVVGNIYSSKFTLNPLKWLSENLTDDYSLNKIYDYDIEVKGKAIWKQGDEGTRKTIIANLNKNAILYTRQVTTNKGELFNRKMVSPDNNPDVPIKKGLDVDKYGGYKSKLTAYFILVEYKNSSGKVCRNIESIPLYLEKEFKRAPEDLTRYLEESYGLNEVKVIIPKIKKNTLFKIDGFPMHLRGTTGRQVLFQNAVQNIIDVEKEIYIKNIERYLIKLDRQKDSKAVLKIDEYDKITKEKNLDIYDYLIQKNITTIYKDRPANCINILKSGRDRFEKIELEKQCIVIGEVLGLFKCRPISADLSLVGGGKRVGNIQITKKISLSEEAVIIYQSVTGIYEKKINIL